jgi:hypothetical protein
MCVRDKSVMLMQRQSNETAGRSGTAERSGTAGKVDVTGLEKGKWINRGTHITSPICIIDNGFSHHRTPYA